MREWENGGRLCVFLCHENPLCVLFKSKSATTEHHCKSDDDDNDNDKDDNDDDNDNDGNDDDGEDDADDDNHKSSPFSSSEII